jgi:hypothetical protein
MQRRLLTTLGLLSALHLVTAVGFADNKENHPDQIGDRDVGKGLIMNADNEAELAGVMAREIGQVAARHATRQATKGETANLATIALIFMGGWAGYGIRQAAGVMIPMSFLNFIAP